MKRLIAAAVLIGLTVSACQPQVYYVTSPRPPERHRAPKDDTPPPPPPPPPTAWPGPGR